MKDTQFNHKSTNPHQNRPHQNRIDSLSKSFVIFGAESSGKTTLAQELAQRYDTFLNPEYARLYLDTKMRYGLAKDTHSLTYTDAEAIAIAQLNSEKQMKILAQAARKPFFFLDTNLLSTYIYIKYIYKKELQWLLDAIEEQNYNHYLLLAPNLDWEADPQRSSPQDRAFYFEKMQAYLDNTHTPYFLIDRKGKQRTQQAIEIIENLTAPPP